MTHPGNVCTFRCPRHGVFKFNIMSERGYLRKEARCPKCGMIVMTATGAVRPPVKWAWLTGNRR